jgi:hypothetical protein
MPLFADAGTLDTKRGLTTSRSCTTWASRSSFSSDVSSTLLNDVQQFAEDVLFNINRSTTSFDTRFEERAWTVRNNQLVEDALSSDKTGRALPMNGKRMSLKEVRPRTPELAWSALPDTEEECRAQLVAVMYGEEDRPRSFLDLNGHF